MLYDGDLYCISCFFNPFGYQSRLKNFQTFYEKLSQQTTNIRIIELGLTEESLKLHNIVNGDHLTQLVDNELLWHKESLLNILISQKLPESCKKVAWLDSDIIFLNEDWLEKTSQALDNFNSVQPFSWAVNLPKGLFNPEGIDYQSFPIKHGDVARVYSYILSLQEGKSDGHPGFCWAARREIVEKSGLYTNGIFGGSDWTISRAITYRHFNNILLDRYTKYHIADYVKWAQPLAEAVGENFGYVDNIVFHLWHGKVGNRQYANRLSVLKENSYNPQVDLVSKENGLRGLSEVGQRLVGPYLDLCRARNEDE